MAQRTIHYCFAKKLMNTGLIRDEDRFLIGSILPDAYRDMDCRKKAHIQSDRIPGKRFFDFDAFYDTYSGQILADDLYLGYYLHLVEDDLYREFFHKKHRLPRMRNEKDVEDLHHDYHLINHLIVNTFGLEYTIRKPEKIEEEEIFSLVPFFLDDFLKEFKEDFQEDPKGEYRFFTGELALSFIEEYEELLKEECIAVKEGRRFLKAEEYAWDLHPAL